MIGKKNFHPEHNYLIGEHGVVENVVVLIKLVLEEPGEEFQLRILESLDAVFSKSTRNIVLCKDLNLTNVLLEMLPNIKLDKPFSKNEEGLMFFFLIWVLFRYCFVDY